MRAAAVGDYSNGIAAELPWAGLAMCRLADGRVTFGRAIQSLVLERR